jgi:hypothetical protein
MSPGEKKKRPLLEKHLLHATDLLLLYAKLTANGK